MGTGGPRGRKTSRRNKDDARLEKATRETNIEGWQRTDERRKEGWTPGVRGNERETLYIGERSFVSDGSCVKGRVPGPARNRRRKGGERHRRALDRLRSRAHIKVLSYDQLPGRDPSLSSYGYWRGTEPSEKTGLPHHFYIRMPEYFSELRDVCYSILGSPSPPPRVHTFAREYIFSCGPAYFWQRIPREGAWTDAPIRCPSNPRD